MAHGCCKLLWPRTLLKELDFKQGEPMTLNCDSDSTIKLAKNPVYHK